MGIDRRTMLKGLVASSVGVATGTAGYGFSARHHLSVTREAVSVIGLPDGLSGLRIGMLTDLHRSRWVSHEDVNAAVTALQAEQPDIIVLGGDYVTLADRRYMGPVAEELASLHAPHGVFGILGNHDDDQNMPAALTRGGVSILKDARTHVTINGEGLDLVGIRVLDPPTQRTGHPRAGCYGYVVLLAHDPRRLSEAAALHIPLVLAGHTHGGQIVLPGLGAIAAQRFPVIAGVGRQGTTTMFVSRGLGTVFVPVRLNCPPEVAILTLQGAHA